MRVLSIQQPFAQLVVRGVKRLEVRPWTTKYRGRIAIHASSAVPSRDIVREWKRDREMALRFADQGWLDREDLKALPRSAIIGTVELVGVYLGKEVHEGNTGHFAWNLATNQMEVAAADPRTGHLRPVESRKRPLSVKTPHDEYAWVFADPVEIDPITDVAGAQNLWNLVGELESVIADRERLSRRGSWRATEVSPARRAKGRRAWQKVWETEREQLVRGVEERVELRRETARIRFTPEFEAHVRVDLTQYVKRNRVAKDGTGELQVRVELHLRSQFDGREVVSADEFERRIRLRLRKEADERRASARKQDRRRRLLALLDTLREKPARGASGLDNIRAQLEAALNKLLDEEEEDIEFVRRLAFPDAAEKAARGAARAKAREEERAAAARAAEREAARIAARTPAEADAEAYVELIELLWGDREGSPWDVFL